MSKNYQKAARGWLYALAVVIAGTCFGASPAQSATCFLPSGECSTGKIGAGPSGGESTPEYCIGYNITEKEFNEKYNNACWDCSDSCVKTSGGTFYNCKEVKNDNFLTWYSSQNVCCTNGTKYDKSEGKCCKNGNCHPCPAGQKWSAIGECICDGDAPKDKYDKCCESPNVLDDDRNCVAPCTPKDCSDYPYTSDPGNSDKCEIGCNKGTRYKCKSGYTYSNSTGKCEVPPSCPTGYSTKYQSVNDCGTTGAKGYDFDSKGTLNGKVCGRCTTTNCEGAYGPEVTAADCKEGEVYSTNGYYDGEDICGLCSKPTEIRDIYIWAEEYKANGLGYYYLKASEAVHTNLLISLSVNVYHDERGEDNGPVSSQDGCQMQAGLASGETIGEKNRCDKMIYNDIAANYTQFYINYKDTGKPEWDNKVIDGYRYHWKEIPQVVKPTITIALEYDGESSANGGYSGGSDSVKFTNSSSDGKSYTVKLIIYGDGDDGINYPLTVTQGNWVTYSSYSSQAGDCDVYGDCNAGWDTSSREFSSYASSMSVVINSQTVKTGLPVTGLNGKSYTTDNYIIKFVENKTCAQLGYKNENSCGKGYGLESAKDASGKYIIGSDGSCYNCIKDVCEKMSTANTYYYTPAQKMNPKVQCGEGISFVSETINGTRCLKCAKGLGGGLFFRWHK